MPFSLDSPEYIHRTQQPFEPPDIPIAALKLAIPAHCWTRSTTKGVLCGLRLWSISALLLYAAHHINTILALIPSQNPYLLTTAKAFLWTQYWFWQGLAWAGFWSYGHEATHGNLSTHSLLNNTLGFLSHCVALTPYYAWASTHNRHHKTANNLDEDETFIPHVRSEYGLDHDAEEGTVREALEDAPLVTLARLLFMQFFGMHIYFTCNTMGSKKYPKGANHWNPFGGLFKQEEQVRIILSDIGVGTMLTILTIWARRTSLYNVFILYFIPFLLTNHWVVAEVFLHHSCPSIPLYRNGKWTRVRGALSTVDRPFLGWAGKFFLLGVCHFHTVHHLFSTIPFYHLEEATAAIKPILGPVYNYDSTPILWALWRSFNECAFVEDEGDVVFYRDARGRARRMLKSELGNEKPVPEPELKEKLVVVEDAEKERCRNNEEKTEVSQTPNHDKH